jgi:hypothetical protein
MVQSVKQSQTRHSLFTTITLLAQVLPSNRSTYSQLTHVRGSFYLIRTILIFCRQRR